MSRHVVPTALLCLSAVPALAAEPLPPALGDAIEVVARGCEAPAATATPAITTFDVLDIERRQAQTVADLLAEAPGALVVTDGPRGQNSRVYLRGAAVTQTLVIVDGVPQNDPTTGGGYDFSDLSTAGVERVDVLRGSYGVLYGSEAMGGVVAVTTRRGAGEWGGVASAEGGSFGTHRGTFGAGGGDDAFDLWAGAFHEGASGERDREDFRSTGGHVRMGFRIAPSLRADLSLRVVETDLEVPLDFPGFGSTIIPPDGNIDRTRDTNSSALTLTHDADAVTTRFTVSRLLVESTFVNGADGPVLVDPDFTPGTGDEFTAVRDELVTSNRASDVRLRLASTVRVARLLSCAAPSDGGFDLDVTLGGETLDESSRTAARYPKFGAPGYDSSLTDRSIDTHSAFALAEVRLPDRGPVRGAVISAGARRDRHDDFGGETSPYAGARFVVAPTGTTIRASWGEGFRAPKPSELDDPSAGNPDLGPETSRSLDAGISQPLMDGRVVAGVTAFRLETDDLIAFDPTATSPSRPFGQLANFGSARTTGAEWELHAELGGGFTVRGAYTRQNPRDAGTGEPLPNRSREILAAGVAWERGALLVSLDALWTTKFPAQGGEYAYPEPDERRAPGRRALVGLTARWRASDTATFYARVENLLDDDFVATPTSPAGAPLGVFAGVELRF